MRRWRRSSALVAVSLLIASIVASLFVLLTPWTAACLETASREAVVVPIVNPAVVGQRGAVIASLVLISAFLRVLTRGSIVRTVLLETLLALLMIPAVVSRVVAPLVTRKCLGDLVAYLRLQCLTVLEFLKQLRLLLVRRHIV